MKALTIGVWALVILQIPAAVSKLNNNGCVSEMFKHLEANDWSGPLKAAAYNYCQGGHGRPDTL